MNESTSPKGMSRAELAVGVACRPAVGFMISDVQVFPGARGTTRVAFASLAVAIMVFQGNERGAYIFI